jgi:hypothetical protein
MDWILVDFGFAKCYINEIIILNLIPWYHMQHLQEVFDLFKKHNLKLHLGKC